MKILIVAESPHTIERLHTILGSESGYEALTYTMLLKALDNITEIRPDAVIISAGDFPRHWKLFIRYLRSSVVKSNPDIYLLTDDKFTDDEQNKAESLGCKRVIIEADLDEYVTIADLFGQSGEALGDDTLAPDSSLGADGDTLGDDTLAPDSSLGADGDTLGDDALAPDNSLGTDGEAPDYTLDDSEAIAEATPPNESAGETIETAAIDDGVDWQLSDDDSDVSLDDSEAIAEATPPNESAGETIETADNETLQSPAAAAIDDGVDWQLSDDDSDVSLDDSEAIAEATPPNESAGETIETAAIDDGVDWQLSDDGSDVSLDDSEAIAEATPPNESAGETIETADNETLHSDSPLLHSDLGVMIKSEDELDDVPAVRRAQVLLAHPSSGKLVSALVDLLKIEDDGNGSLCFVPDSLPSVCFADGERVRSCVLRDESGTLRDVTLDVVGTLGASSYDCRVTLLAS